MEMDNAVFEISLDGQKLQVVDSIQFLGMIIDCDLTWENHCQKVANKASRTSGILGRLKNFLPKRALQTIYDSLFMSHIQYGLEIWGGNSASKGMKRLSGLQKKAIRHLSKSHYLAHTEPRMKNLGLLKITDQHLFQCAKLAHDMVHLRSPKNLQNSLNLCTETHSYSLRSVIDNPLEVRENQSSRRETKSGFSKLGPKIWNSVPEKIKEIKSKYGFNRKLKEHILEGYAGKLVCSNPLCRDSQFHFHP